MKTIRTSPLRLVPRSGFPRLLNAARRLTVLAMLASLLTLPVFRAVAQPVLTPAYITVKTYMANGCYSNTMGLVYETGVSTLNWTAGSGGVATFYSLHAMPSLTYTNAALLVSYDPWNIAFVNSRTVWPPVGTGTDTTITGFLGLNPQIPTTVTNYFLVSRPPGSSPPYYYVTNIYNIPPALPVTNITTGLDQPRPPCPWPHYTDVVSTSASYDGSQTSLATNTVHVTVDLFTGHSRNTLYLGRPNTFTLLSVSASGVGNNFAGGPVGFADISVVGEHLNADYQAFIKQPPAIVVDATPVIANSSNFTYRVDVTGHKIVTLSRAYHFLFGYFGNTPPDINELRGNFEAGAALLSKDDDTKVPDNDPTVIPPGNAGHDPAKWDEAKYNYDDVPLYVEFQILDGTKQPPSMLPIFPVQFEGQQYFDINERQNAIDLLNSLPANVLQVNSMSFAYGRSDAIGGSSMVVERAVDPSTLIHEWGHLVGLEHRNWPVTNYFTDPNGLVVPVVTIPNPGPEVTAIMGATNSPASAVSINRRERNAYTLSNILFR